MQRRSFVKLLGGAVAWPLAARAQQSAMPVVGFLNGTSPQGYARELSAFLKGLSEAGYIEGQNVAIEYRWAEGHYERLPALAADLVHLQVSVIAATSTPANLTAKAATSTIPIVFTTGSDPVQLGMVASLNRPGGNVTGVTQLNTEIVPKRAELAHELVPNVTVIGFLINPGSPDEEILERVSRAASAALGVQFRILQASTEREIDDAFTTFVQLGAGALVIGGDAFFNSRAEFLAALSLRHSLPSVYQNHEFTEAGGLISYGGSLTDSYHLAGVYTGRILKGEKPADLPVQQSTKVELIINLKTARKFGLNVPLSLLGRADELIE